MEKLPVRYMPVGCSIAISLCKSKVNHVNLMSKHKLKAPGRKGIKKIEEMIEVKI